MRRKDRMAHAERKKNFISGSASELIGIYGKAAIKDIRDKIYKGCLLVVFSQGLYFILRKGVAQICGTYKY